jgi:IS30 family transposase
MPKTTYVHLSKEERDPIAVLRGEGRSIRSVARELGRDPGTLSRELKRNAPPVHTGYYLPHKAHERAVARNCVTHRRDRLKDPKVRRYIRERIRSGWSPEIIAGRWSLLHPELAVSHEAVSQWVYAEARDLIPFPVRAHKKRQKRGHSRKHRKVHIPNRISISEHPEAVEKRKIAGHWETDTAVSRQSKVAIQVSIERKTRYSKLARLKAKIAREMSKALTRRLSRLPRRLRRTVTYDNGTENTEHERTNKILGTKSYFCKPYHSLEKGSVENDIGIVRRFLPKKTDFAAVSSKDLRKLERWLNNRPRKCLNYRIPAEAMWDECCT